MSAITLDPLVDRIVSFLREIGIKCSFENVGETFLPGIDVRRGGLIIDRAELKYPGDLLHEAGHLAVAPQKLRPHLNGEVTIPDRNPDLLELQAMLWSYAACIYLDIEPAVVFHPDGYHGRSAALLNNFELGVFIGVQGLEAAGLTLSPEDAAKSGSRPFPVMQKWLRD